MFFDWTYVVLVMPFVILSLWASTRVNSTFKKYSQQEGRGLLFPIKIKTTPHIMPDLFTVSKYECVKTQ